MTDSPSSNRYNLPISERNTASKSSTSNPASDTSRSLAIRDKHQKKMLAELLLMAALILCTLWMVVQSGIMESVKPHGSRDKVIALAGIPLALMAALAIHELGHLIVGLWEGFKFQMFVVGPLGAKEEQGKVKFYLNTNLAYFGGLAATTPINNDPSNAQKMARIVIAGPITSILYMFACFLMGQFIGGSFALWLYTSGITSIAIFFATTVPSKTGMFFTDRKRYQRLTTPGNEQEVEVAMLRIIGGYAQKESYRDVDKADIEKLITDPDPSIQHYGLFNLLCYQLEIEHQIDPKSADRYQAACQHVSPAMVKIFDAEIEKSKEAFANPGTT